MCDEPDGSICMLSTPGGLVMAVRSESAAATKVIPAKEALSGPRADEHRAAIDKEVKWGHVEKFKTYILLPISDKPNDEAIIGLKLILAEKYGAANEFLKAKSRLVARGDQQVEGRDYDPFETTSPMLNYASLRLMISIAANTERPLSTSDATMAYLNASITHPVWARLPPLLREYTGDGEELVAYVTKALYGLKSAGHAWSAEINGHLTRPRADGGMGFVRSTGEPCMYRWEDGDEWAIIGLACDNAIHLESSDAVHADVLARLQAKYEWVDEGRATVALAHNPMSFSKVKHVARRHHYVRECVEDGTIAAKSISTEHNVSDIFTKALEPKKFKLFRAALMNLPLESLA